jgi:hypothetical protein
MVTKRLQAYNVTCCNFDCYCRGVVTWIVTYLAQGKILLTHPLKAALPLRTTALVGRPALELERRPPVGSDDNAEPCGHGLGARLRQVLQHPHEYVVCDHLLSGVVDGGLVEEEGGGGLHPGSREHVPPDDDLTKKNQTLKKPGCTLDFCKILTSVNRKEKLGLAMNIRF